MLFEKNPTTETKVIAQIFNNTVATYKYYWFVSILDIVVKENRHQLSFWEIIIGMITEAWYPIHFFRLSFGKSDSLYIQIIELQKELNIPIDAKKEHIKSVLTRNLNAPKTAKLLKVFALNVPYRFLSPWIEFTNNSEVVYLSQSFTNNCLYAIKDETIEINPKWEHYLNENYMVLRDFSFWNLTLFIQKRNPNVPDIPAKLEKSMLRESLAKQRHFWDEYININGSITCIYTGKQLFKKEYDLDHFIPWSYFTNDLIWNIIPADHKANISKSNNLPLLEKYLLPFSRIHQQAIQAIYPKNPNNKLLEDYLILHDSISELTRLSENDFLNVFQKTFAPMVQIAENRGFSYWNKSYEQ